MSGHIIKRQNRFAWRRTVHGITIQIPLRTADQRVAIEIGAAATAASYAAFHDILTRGLAPRDGRRMIETTAARAAAQIILRDEKMFFFPFPFEPAREMRERGFAEDHIHRWIKGRLHTPTDEDLRGWDPEDIAEYKAILAGVPYHPPVKDAPQSGVVIHNYYHAPQATPAPQAPAPLATATQAENPALVFADTATQPPIDNVEAGRLPVPDLVEKIITSDLRRNRVNEATSRGFRTSVGLFCEICRITDVEEITQGKIEEFCAALDLLPPDYRRGAKGRATPIWDIIEKAKADGVETGLSSKTVNKQLEAIQKLLRHARAHGIDLPQMEVSILRVKDDESVKEKRYPFTQDEIKRLFEQPGLNLSSERGALFWNAHLAAYTGARREEIAGLDRDDITEKDGMPVILIKSNEHRTLKNGQSGRVVPVHRDLIDLGFLDYAKARDPGLLFDVKKKGKSFGNAFDYAWQKVKKAVIAEGDPKTFHSFRHSAIQRLIDKNVPLNVRAELFGHDHGHIEGRIYGGQMDTELLKNAVDLLPSVR